MARDTAREKDDEPPLLDRRSYLKLAGTAAASVAAAGAVGGSANAADYRTITVPAGSHKLIRVGDGETFENVLIDQTAPGAGAKIIASGSNWTIRNVGFKGEHHGNSFMLVPGVSDPNGEGVIENVYMGDGQPVGTGGGGIWVNANLPHRGTLTLKGVHIGLTINNGLYASGPGAQGYDGVTNVEDSYFYANNIANIRLSARGGRTAYVRNSVVKVDGSTRACGDHCSKPGAIVDRGVWAMYGPVEVIDSDVQGSLVSGYGGSIVKKNSRFGSSADTTPPKAAPMTAEEAASGATGGSSTADASASDATATEQPSLTNTIKIESDGGGVATYEFTVKDAVAKGEDAWEDTVNGKTVSGSVGPDSGVDSFRYATAITEFTLDGPATVSRNGEVVDPMDLVTSEDDSEKGAAKDLPNLLLVDGSASPGEAASYVFEVDGEMEKSSALGSINADDTISDGKVTGRVVGGKDAYRYSGTVTGFQLNGSAAVVFEDND